AVSRCRVALGGVEGTPGILAVADRVGLYHVASMLEIAVRPLGTLRHGREARETPVQVHSGEPPPRARRVTRSRSAPAAELAGPEGVPAGAFGRRAPDLRRLHALPALGGSRQIETSVPRRRETGRRLPEARLLREPAGGAARVHGAHRSCDEGHEREPDPEPRGRPPHHPPPSPPPPR